MGGNDFAMISFNVTDCSSQFTRNQLVLANLVYQLLPCRLKQNRYFLFHLNWGLSFVVVPKYRSSLGIG